MPPRRAKRSPPAISIRSRISPRPFRICSSISPIFATPKSIDFVERVKKAINAWQVERIDPTSIADGPVVEIYIGTEGLPPKPKPVKRPDKRKKSRPA